MRQSNAVIKGRGGFTLLEILVALVLIGLLVGAVVPSVLNQVGRGETNRVMEDLDGVGEATRMFRVDVSRWPGDLEDVMSQPDGTDTDLDGTAYPAGLLSRWDGPYLDGAQLEAGNTLETASGGSIDNAFDDTQTLNGQTYLSLTVTGLTTELHEDLSVAIDGDDVLTLNDDAGGRVRAVSGTLYYLAAPVR